MSHSADIISFLLVLPQKTFFKVLLRQRLVKDISLNDMTPHLFKIVKLLLCLYALCNHFLSKLVQKLDNAPQHHHIFVFAGIFLLQRNKGLVNLYNI